MWSKLQGWPEAAVSRLATALHLLEGPRLRKVQFGYEKAGLIVTQEPIPWNAERVWIEASIEVPANDSVCRADFELCRPGFPPVAPETLTVGPDQNWLLTFRLPPPQQTTPVVLCRRQKVLTRLVLPFLSADEFLSHLRLEAPAFLALLGNRYVPCQAFVKAQCRGLLASGILASPTSLLPLVDLDILLELHEPFRSQPQQRTIALTREQFTTRRALVSAPLGDCLECVGAWSVAWTVAGRKLATLPVRVVSPEAFEASVYLIDSRFVSQSDGGEQTFSSYLPGPDGVANLGPCFRLASRIPCMAGLCSLEVRSQLRPPAPLPLVQTQEVLVTDGPSLLIPFTWPAAEFRLLTAVDLYHQGQRLGSLTVSSTPVAQFTGEGGFQDAPDYGWTAAAEDEMNGRLSRLMPVAEEGALATPWWQL